MSASGSFGVNYKRTWDGVSTPLPAKLGDLGSCPEGEFVFVKASAAVGQYDFVLVAKDNTAAKTGTGAIGTVNQVGVAQVAFASGEYGWVWIGGANGGGIGSGIKGNLLASCVVDVPLLNSGTAGSADDTGTVRIQNVASTVTVGGSAAAVELRSTGHLVVNG